MAQYPSIAAGDELTAELLLSMLPRFVVKAANTTRTSTATPADDTELTLPVEANATYFVEFFLYYSAINAEQFRTEWSVPTGTTGNRNVIGAGSTANQSSLDNVSGRFGIHGYATNVIYGTRNSTNQCYAVETATVTTGGTSGNVTLQWAQGTSGSTGTVLYAGSMMRVTRLA